MADSAVLLKLRLSRAVGKSGAIRLLTGWAAGLRVGLCCLRFDEQE